ncbi:MAG: RluA family pseudouridine synthase [Fulvivirga sp.]|nr:RluA family pseudouridine synthase [Fulvivirga sp.]
MKNKIKVLYEDNHLLIVNKPAGQLVQADKTGDQTLADEAKAYIKEKYNKPGDVFLGVIHRIDRPVSGVVVLARTSKALERMNKLFKDRKVTKTYWAISDAKPPQVSDTLEHWLKKNHKINKTVASNKKSGKAQKAILDYELIGKIGANYLLQVNPVTGRPHQIRVQLAKIGCPIIGDVKYGASKPNRDGSIHLHAKSIQFEHPVKREQLHVEAPIPKEQIWQLFAGV